jgi:hypothetical protein
MFKNRGNAPALTKREFQTRIPFRGVLRYSMVIKTQRSGYPLEVRGDFIEFGRPE